MELNNMLKPFEDVPWHAQKENMGHYSLHWLLPPAGSPLLMTPTLMAPTAMRLWLTKVSSDWEARSHSPPICLAEAMPSDDHRRSRYDPQPRAEQPEECWLYFYSMEALDSKPVDIEPSDVPSEVQAYLKEPCLPQTTDPMAGQQVRTSTPGEDGNSSSGDSRFQHCLHPCRYSIVLLVMPINKLCWRMLRSKNLIFI